MIKIINYMKRHVKQQQNKQLTKILNNLNCKNINKMGQGTCEYFSLYLCLEYSDGKIKIRKRKTQKIKINKFCIIHLFQ